jgi:hypothetical protein
MELFEVYFTNLLFPDIVQGLSLVIDNSDNSGIVKHECCRPNKSRDAEGEGFSQLEQCVHVCIPHELAPQFNFLTRCHRDTMAEMAKMDVEVSMDCMLVSVERPWLHGELFVDADLDVPKK